MRIKYKDMIKKYANKNNITYEEAKKLFTSIEQFVIDYLSDVSSGDENIITPIRGLVLSSKKVRRNRLSNPDNESIFVKAEFNKYFKKKINMDSDNRYSSLWFL